MTKITKTIYRSALIISFLAINILIIYGLGSVYVYINTGADKSNMLNIDMDGGRFYEPKLSWRSIENPGRPMEEVTLSKISDDYINSWYVRNLALKTNNPVGIDNFYTDSSRVKLFQSLNYNKENNITIEATSLSHNPELVFYSADGQLVIFNDYNVVDFQNVFKEDELISSDLDTTNFQVIMLLEDGFWRIRHLKKINSNNSQDIKMSNPLFKVEANQILMGDKVFNIKGINYYPQNTPWDMFGDKFDPLIIKKDFKIIRKMNMNTIRIFVQYDDFGKESVPEEKLIKLKKLLDLAEETRLKVIVTLFDFYGDYTVSNWTFTHRQLEQIVTRFKEHKAILAWDLKNEPDLDFKKRGKENVLEWLKVMAKLTKEFDPNHLITIGWSKPESAGDLSELVDFVSFHFYKEPEVFSQSLETLKNEVNQKPVVLQEYGISTNRGFWSPLGNNENKQYEYYRKMQAQLDGEELAFIVWTLYDFDFVPNSVAGRRPWRIKKQKHFGLLDCFGDPKRAFFIFSDS